MRARARSDEYTVAERKKRARKMRLRSKFAGGKMVRGIAGRLTMASGIMMEGEFYYCREREREFRVDVYSTDK